MTKNDELLIPILALVDQIFTPLRVWDDGRCALIAEQRQNYLSRGVTFSTGSSERERKEGERIRKQLAASKLIRLVKSKSRVTGVVLCQETEVRLRALCDLPNQDEAKARIDRIAGLQQAGTCFVHLDNVWIPETNITGFAYTGDSSPNEHFHDLQTDLLPALLRGWVISNSSIHGHVSYSITPQGNEMLNGRLPLVIGTAGPDEAASDLYWASRTEARTALSRAKAEHAGESGFIPLPVSNGVAEPR